jgi:hypothetical protein
MMTVAPASTAMAINTAHADAAAARTVCAMAFPQ